MSKVIDFHAHFLDRKVAELTGDKTLLSNFGARPSYPLHVGMLESEVQIEHMDRCGIDIHVISSPMVIQGTSWAAPELEIDLVRRINDRAADWVAKHPNRLVGTFVLPTSSMKAGLAELARCTEDLGLRILNTSTSIAGHYLGEPEILPLWEAVNERGVLAFVHPEGNPDPWLQKFAMWNSIGQSIEEAKGMASMILGGLIERYPKTRILVAHGGGYFPLYMGRVDRNFTDKPASAENITRPPSAYLRNFFFDSCVYSPLSLRFLIEAVGSDRIVVGSDYAVGDMDPLSSLRRVSGLTEEQFGAISAVNGSTLLRDLGSTISGLD